MKKIYISVPITGQEEIARKKCEEYKELVGDIFKEKGYELISPFDVVKETDKPYSYYIGEDMKVLLECDKVVFLSGWRESKGCRLEMEACKLYEIPTFFSAQL